MDRLTVMMILSHQFGVTHRLTNAPEGLSSSRSARRLDKTLSTDDVPAHTFDRVEKLVAGEIVAIEIDLLPIGLAFHPGEQLRFVISSRNLLGTLMPAIREYVGANSGTHVIHTGGEHASYRQLPSQTK